MSAAAAPDASRVPPVPLGLTLDPFPAFRCDVAVVHALGAALDTPADKPLSFNSFNGSRTNLPATHAAATATLMEWIASGVLHQDSAPALYVYDQQLPDGLHVRGLLGALGLSPASAGIVLPHEDTRPEPILDRLALMNATGADLEPIMVVYDGGPVVARAIEAALSGPLLMEAGSSDGARHRLAGVTEGSVLAAIARELLPRQALIADGHHRHASYLRRQADHWSAGDGRGPWDFGLALLVDSAQEGLAVRAIHRVLESFPLASAVALVGAVARVTPLVDRGLATTSAGWLDRLTEATRTDCEQHRPAFVLAAGSTAFLVDRFDPAAVAAALPPNVGPALRGLNVTVLARYLLPHVLGLAEHGGRDVGDPRAAALLAEASGGTAILLPPVSFHDVLRVAAEGDRMPRKSTLFLPKPASGLVLRLLEDHAETHLVSDVISTS